MPSSCLTVKGRAACVSACDVRSLPAVARRAKVGAACDGVRRGDHRAPSPLVLCSTDRGQDRIKPRRKDEVSLFRTTGDADGLRFPPKGQRELAWGRRQVPGDAMGGAAMEDTLDGLTHGAPHVGVNH